MVLTLLLLSLSIAGFIVVFTQLREETRLQKVVSALPFPFSHAIGCPLCFSYWLSLLGVILIDPFASWDIPWRFAGNPDWLEPAFRILAGWFAVGFLANAWRVTYMLVGKDMSLADLEAKQLREELD